MNEWYELVNGLETAVPPMEKQAQQRILHRVQRYRRKKLRLAWVAAAVLLLTACGVAAVRFTGWFWPVAADYRDPAASEAHFARMGQALNQSQTVDGKTVTLQAALYDGEILTLALSGDAEIEAAYVHPPADAEELQPWLEKDPDLLRSSYFQAEIKLWEDLTLLQRKLPYRDEPRELTVLLETENGDYDFAVTLEPKAVRRQLTGQKKIVLAGCEMTLNAITVTPFTVTVELAGTGEPPEDLWITGLDLGEGRQFHSSSHSCRLERDDEGNWSAILTTGPGERILDPETVTGVYIGEERISVDLLS